MSRKSEDTKETVPIPKEKYRDSRKQIKATFQNMIYDLDLVDIDEWEDEWFFEQYEEVPKKRKR